MSIITPTGMLSFPHLFEKRPRAPGGEPVYSMSLIFNERAQNTKAYKEMEARVVELARVLFGDKVDDPKFINRLLANNQWPLKRADVKDYEGYEAGSIVISPWSNKRPGVVGPDPEVDVEIADDVWAGQLARAEINPFPYTEPKKGVGVGLNNVQIIKFDMPRIDGRKAANKVFGKVEEVDADDNPV